MACLRNCLKTERFINKFRDYNILWFNMCEKCRSCKSECESKSSHVDVQLCKVNCCDICRFSDTYGIRIVKYTLGEDPVGLCEICFECLKNIMGKISDIIGDE